MKYTPPKKEVLFLVSQKRNNDGESYMTTTVPFIDVINWKDEKTGEVRERKIRYIKGATSIFADEQPEHYDLKWESTKMKPRSLRIDNGMHRVSPTEVMLMKYLMCCNYNESNPSRKTNITPIIRVFDAEVFAKTNNDNRSIKIKAQSKVLDMDENTLRAHLITTQAGDTMNAISIYRNMQKEQLTDIALNIVEKDPKRFLESFEAPSTRSKYIIINARLREIIKFDEQTNILSWPNGDIIINPSNGMNAIDALAEFSVTNGAYRDIVEGLREKMANRMGDEEKKNTAIPAEPKKDTRDSYDFLIEKAIEAKVIIDKFPWYVINNKIDDPAEKKPIQVQGLKNLKQMIKDDKELYIDLVERVDKAALPA